MHHRLNVELQLRDGVREDQLAVWPHGIVGQAWDGDGMAIDDEEDAYPRRGEFTTYAMGKGAIEREPDDYKVGTPFATNFMYSRFDSTKAAPRDIAKLVQAGVLNEPRVPSKTAEPGVHRRHGAAVRRAAQ